MTKNEKILLCSDLDRTIIPNGPLPESPKARPLLRHLAEHPDLILVYVTGRDRHLIEYAIQNWELPIPSIAVGDVGTAIYDVGGTYENLTFAEWADWKAVIAADWKGRTTADLQERLLDFNMLRLQESEKQKDFKLSFYTDANADLNWLAEELRKRLLEIHVRASIITSVDEMANTGLVDIVPARATKVDAVYHIVKTVTLDESRVIYAGDSGNDLPALTSGLNAVLVKNAAPEVLQQAMHLSRQNGTTDRLYPAKGGFMRMNGNYSAGVIEGVAKFMPETESWLRRFS